MNIYDLINQDEFDNMQIDYQNDNQDDNQGDNENKEQNKCLISDKILDENHITLDCNHKFNYIPLFNEVKNQKFTKNYFDTSRPLFHQIKCPYCRTITSKILPYFSAIYDVKFNGVNYNNKFKKVQMYKCEHVWPKLNKTCGDNACKTEYGCLCNKHYNLEKNKKLKKSKLNNNNNNNNINNVEDILKIIKLNNYLEDGSYEKLTIPQLKILLKKNNCKVGGIKKDLLARILERKQFCNENNVEWNNALYDVTEVN